MSFPQAKRSTVSLTVLRSRGSAVRLTALRPARRPGTGSSRAFTLIELLVVMGIIVTLVAAIGFALAGRGGEGAALANAQSLVGGLIGSARAQAALNQTNARLIVYAQMPPSGDAAKYLRTLQVVRLETLANGRTVWVAAGDPVTLPAPICVVPTAPVPTNHLGLPSGQTWNNNVQTGPVSTFTTLTGFNYRGQSNSGNQFFGLNGQSGRIFYLEFAPDGTIASPNTTPIKIALATATLSGSSFPLFNNAFRVRGLFIRRTGAISFVDDATGF
jgi:prepilin-type N-terminal cleavage/methylation domain-containing protein